MENKLYYFNPNDYGEQYFTVAKTKEDAYRNLLIFLKKQWDDVVFAFYYQEVYEKWSTVDPQNEATYPDAYTIDEISEGEVIKSEIS